MFKQRQHFMLAIMAICICTLTYGQKMPEHKKKVYVSPEGKMYVSKSAPVYLWLSTTPEQSGSHYQLKSERTPKYTNPMYFDSEGLNTIRSPWEVDTTSKNIVYPKQDIIFEVYADSKHPVTSINYGNTKIFNKKGKLFINGKTEIVLKATDEQSGVENIYFSVDSSEFKVYSTPIILDEEKEYTIKYYSVDNVGNVEPLKKVVISIDKTSPKTSMIINGDYNENVLAGNAAISLKPDDLSSGIASTLYSLDDGPLKKYLGSINAANLAQGDHKIAYYSTDYVDNAETGQTFDFYVDKTPPTIVQEIIGKSFVANGREFSSGRSQLKLTTFDNKAGIKEVYYAINNDEFKKYEKPVLLSGAGGNIRIKAYAVDKVNNRSDAVEEASKTSVPYIDLSGPELGHSFNGPVFFSYDSIYINSKTKIQLKASDPESGLSKIEYSVDNGESRTYQQPFSIETEGIHNIQITGYDNVENTNTTKAIVIEDNNGPEIFTRFGTLPIGSINLNGKNITLYPAHTVLFISATDSKSGFNHMTFSLNGSKQKPFLGLINGFSKKENTIIIKAYDKLGNESTSTINFYIKD